MCCPNGVFVAALSDSASVCFRGVGECRVLCDKLITMDARGLDVGDIVDRFAFWV